MPETEGWGWVNGLSQWPGARWSPGGGRCRNRNVKDYGLKSPRANKGTTVSLPIRQRRQKMDGSVPRRDRLEKGGKGLLGGKGCLEEVWECGDRREDDR